MVEVIKDKVIKCITHIKLVSKKKVKTERIKAQLIRKAITTTKLGQKKT